MSLYQEFVDRRSVLQKATWQDVTPRLLHILDWMDGHPEIKVILDELRGDPAIIQIMNVRRPSMPLNLLPHNKSQGWD